jgi:hypothetical protein
MSLLTLGEMPAGGQEHEWGRQCAPISEAKRDFAQPQLHNFADTAAPFANLDLVVSVDTAVAHLAGALGRPVCLLDRFDHCWRWLAGRRDTPWYGAMRIYRQPRPGDWDRSWPNYPPICEHSPKGGTQPCTRVKQLPAHHGAPRGHQSNPRGPRLPSPARNPCRFFRPWRR